MIEIIVVTLLGAFSSCILFYALQEATDVSK